MGQPIRKRELIEVGKLRQVSLVYRTELEEIGSSEIK